MKYKVGDKVRVKQDLKVYKHYGNDIFTDGMRKYKGKIYEIEKVYVDRYRFKNADYSWTDEMLEPVKDNLKEPIVTYNKNLGVSFIRIGNITICTNNYAISRKHPDDEFNEEIGQALAYKRYLEGR